MTVTPPTATNIPRMIITITITITIELDSTRTKRAAPTFCPPLNGTALIWNQLDVSAEVF